MGITILIVTLRVLANYRRRSLGTDDVVMVLALVSCPDLYILPINSKKSLYFFVHFSFFKFL